MILLPCCSNFPVFFGLASSFFTSLFVIFIYPPACSHVSLLSTTPFFLSLSLSPLIFPHVVSCRAPLDVLLDALLPLPPRYYSACSACVATPGRVHFAFNIVDNAWEGREHEACVALLQPAGCVIKMGIEFAECMETGCRSL